VAGDGVDALNVTVSRPSGTVVLIVLDGEMDLMSSDAFSRRFAQLGLEQGTRLIIDLAGVTFIDSSGINVLVQAARAVEAAGGSAVLAAPSPSTQRVFEIARVAQVVTVESARGDLLAKDATIHPDGLESDLP